MLSTVHTPQIPAPTGTFLPQHASAMEIRYKLQLQRVGIADEFLFALIKQLPYNTIYQEYKYSVAG